MSKFRLMVNSLPKSGTNLLQKCVEVLGYNYSKKSLSSANILGNFYLFRILSRGPLFDRNHVIVGLDIKVAISQKWIEKRLRSINFKEYISAHLNFSEHLFFLLKKYKYKIIYIIRDPRDVLLSHILYAKREKKHLFHNLYKELSMDEAIDITLSGGVYKNLFMYSFASILQDAYGWIKLSKSNANILVVRFEELVGEKGGGKKEDQKQAIYKIANFINYQSELDIDNINLRIYGKSHTFRKGKIFSWKEELSLKQIKKIETSIDNYIKLFGYSLHYE